MTQKGTVFWLTGNSGAGKSTLAFAAQAHFNESTLDHSLARRIIVLDGDEMRRTVSTEESLSAEDRRKHNHRVARLADHLADQGFTVVVSVIAPFATVRQDIDELCAPRWIYVHRSGLDHPDRPYEAPENPDLQIDHDNTSPKDALHTLLTFIETTH